MRLPAYDRRRHTRDGDVFTSDGKSYVFTNQWGRSWAQAMELLKHRYADSGIEYEPTEG